MNKPPGNYGGAERETLAEFVSYAGLFLQEFDDVALLLHTHRVDEDGDESWSEERRDAYRANARKFLEVTRRMADLEWTRQDWQFLAKRNKRLPTLAAPSGCHGQTHKFAQGVDCCRCVYILGKVCL